MKPNELAGRLSAMDRIQAKLGLRFEKPSSEFVEGVQARVNRIAGSLGVEPVKVTLPKSGKFLSQSLTTDQRQVVDNELGSVYAAESVALQERMLSEVKIGETGERMVRLDGDDGVFAREDVTNVTFSNTKFAPTALNGWAGKSRVYWVREQVATRLVNAAKALAAENITMHIEDAFRPEGVQEGLFLRRVTATMQDHPDWSQDRILEEARSKTADRPGIAGHTGGAAVDITLLENGERLPLGNEYPQGGALVALDCPYVTKEEWATRQLFAATMRMAGLTVYPGEDWHASFGDNFATESKGPTIYGPISGFDSASGAVISRSGDYRNPFFTIDEIQSRLRDLSV